MYTILIVDDDISVRSNIEIFLRLEGYDVVSAADGLEALKIIAQKTPDLIISDIILPYVDGVELLKKVQNRFGGNFLPFIFLTSKSDLPSIREGLNMGADDYITKPFELIDLSISVKNRLSKKMYYTSIYEDLKNTITKNIPHELRTPLSVILSHSAYIEREIGALSQDEIKECVSSIKKAGKRLYDRIEKFIFYESLEADTYSKFFNTAFSYTHNVNGDDVQNEISEMAKDYDRQEDIKINIEEALLSISGEHFHFIVRELADNALKFSLKGSPVVIKGNISGDDYCLTVTDYGRGMSSGEISLLAAYKQFNRNIFQQAGLGLGLHLVKKTIDLHKGEMKIESNPAKWTRVNIILKITK